MALAMVERIPGWVGEKSDMMREGFLREMMKLTSSEETSIGALKAICTKQIHSSTAITYVPDGGGGHPKLKRSSHHCPQATLNVASGIICTLPSLKATIRLPLFDGTGEASSGKGALPVEMSVAPPL